MIEGLVFDVQLVLRTFLERARRLYPRREIVEPGHRYTYAEAYERVCRLAAALQALGVGPGERVGTFAWNTHRHFEAYFAVPGIGAICHTLNVRLHPSQVAYVANHAEDSVVLLDADLAAAWPAEEVRGVRHYVVMGGHGLPRLGGAEVHDYEELLASAGGVSWPELQERQAAFLCYTSGTTGDPKGVLYSHRALYLHTLTQVAPDALGLSEADVVMPVVPMFHANAWGLPFSATMVGATLVLPGPAPTPSDLCRLIQEQRVTLAAAVPTVWVGVLEAVEREGWDLSSLRQVACGGSAVPRWLIEAFRDRFGVVVQQGYGMTESGPLAVRCHVKSHLARALDPGALAELRAKQGIPVPGVEVRVVGEDGTDVPPDGRTPGEVWMRGPWVASGYYKGERFADGWLHTGDVATVDPEGYLQVVDRMKDLIKSGGEWISSVELENRIMAHPKVAEAAVVGVAHPRWGERPVAFVVAREEVSPEEIVDFLRPQVARWWIPDRVELVEEIPKTSVGKFDKRALRDRLP